MIDIEYVKENIDGIMDLFCQLHGDLSRSSKSQHRKGMLSDWTKISYKPVVALYHNKQELKNRIASNREISQMLHDQIDALEKEKQTLFSNNIYLKERVVKLESSVERDRKEHLILQEVLSRMFDKHEVFQINHEFHEASGHHLYLKSKKSNGED